MRPHANHPTPSDSVLGGTILKTIEATSLMPVKRSYERMICEPLCQILRIPKAMIVGSSLRMKASYTLESGHPCATSYGIGAHVRRAIEIALDFLLIHFEGDFPATLDIRKASILGREETCSKYPPSHFDGLNISALRRCLKYRLSDRRFWKEMRNFIEDNFTFHPYLRREYGREYCFDIEHPLDSGYYDNQFRQALMRAAGFLIKTKNPSSAPKEIRIPAKSEFSNKKPESLIYLEFKGTGSWRAAADNCAKGGSHV